MRRLKPHKACDAGGWSHETLKQIFQQSQVAERLSRWLENLAFDQPEESPLRRLLWNARVVMLPKPQGGVRPLLMGNHLQKMFFWGGGILPKPCTGFCDQGETKQIKHIRDLCDLRNQSWELQLQNLELKQPLFEVRGVGTVGSLA